ncbi:MAG: pantoate--beta-alanine ligase, partial [Gemmataceae bacterium]|nr:pantoate--beta-alanine ligase [Gemmataceae bacterium]
PAGATLYPPGYRTYVEVHEFQNVLCGVTRPTHFRGVATVVVKLFNIVAPDVAYFGQKDAQQARLIQQLVRDLNLPIELVICPTVREADGLAMSSRNQYLDATERSAATVLYRALEAVRRRIDAGERRSRPLRELAREIIGGEPAARLDYVEIVGWDDLRPVDEVRGRVLIAVAVFIGTTRLIDNLLLTVA